MFCSVLVGINGAMLAVFVGATTFAEKRFEYTALNAESCKIRAGLQWKAQVVTRTPVEFPARSSIFRLNPNACQRPADMTK